MSIAPLASADVLPLAGRVADEVVAAHASAVDTHGRFPEEAVTALGASGLLGILSAADVGGSGLSLREAVDVVERVARACGSTGMITCMHYSATAVLEALGPHQPGLEGVRRDIAAGRHLTTLAFSEVGSRSHFWAPLSTAAIDGDNVVLDARKSWVTSSRRADSFVWSSKPVAGDGASTIWLVPNRAAGLSVPAPFDGLGLRGNDSTAVNAEGVRIPATNRLGPDGGGFDVMMGTVLPWFAALSAGVSVGIMEAATQKAAAHCAGTGFAHLGANLADLPTIRAYLARMRIRTDQARTLLDDTVTAITTGRPDTMLRVLEVRASAAENALEVTELAMRVCGGSAFRKEVGVDRAFRDARAAGVMAPTTDVLYDFIGKALVGLPLF
ncbi:MAG: acyl-CoA dehydrogenase family protein [Myxococcota bacterium]